MSRSRLLIGDRVLTWSGEMRPIQRNGRRSYRGRSAMGRKEIPPICIKAGALADKCPPRPLDFAAPCDAFGRLIDRGQGPRRWRQHRAGRTHQEVEYFHIEPESHDVVVAEGALSESLIDDHNRGMFQNASEYAEFIPA